MSANVSKVYFHALESWLRKGKPDAIRRIQLIARYVQVFRAIELRTRKFIGILAD